MKPENYNKLKKFCEENGFDIPYNDEYALIIEKEDPWKGVEFGEYTGVSCDPFTYGNTYKLVGKIDGIDAFIDNNGYRSGSTLLEGNRRYFKPSTKDPYVDKLEKEAIKRFGEIKEGDVFDRSGLERMCSDPVKVPIDESLSGEGFRYISNEDILLFDGVCIYRNGKWATRVHKKVEVTFNQPTKSLDKKTTTFSFNIPSFDSSKNLGLCVELHEFLDNYLNSTCHDE